MADLMGEVIADLMDQVGPRRPTGVERAGAIEKAVDADQNPRSFAPRIARESKSSPRPRNRSVVCIRKMLH